MVVLQVNGKVRSKIEVSSAITEEKLKEMALSDERLKPWIQDKPIKNTVVVGRKLVNIVV
jgi:leucyl-tRNA synthetase